MDSSSDPLSVTDLALIGQLFEEHRARLLAMLGRRIDPALAGRVGPEDVLADAYLDATRRWRWFRSQTEVSAYAWLYRVALDRLIETWRRETRGRRNVRQEMPWPEESSVVLGLQLVASGTSPSETAARGELRDRMRQAIGLLKDSYREVLWMRHYEGLSFAEVGQVLGLTENNATVRYVRALKRLKECWDGLHGGG